MISFDLYSYHYQSMYESIQVKSKFSLLVNSNRSPLYWMLMFVPGRVRDNIFIGRGLKRSKVLQTAGGFQ